MILRDINDSCKLVHLSSKNWKQDSSKVVKCEKYKSH